MEGSRRYRHIQPAILGHKRARMDTEEISVKQAKVKQAKVKQVQVKQAKIKRRPGRPELKTLDFAGPPEFIGVSHLTAKVWRDRRLEQGFTSDDEFAWWMLRASSNCEHQNRSWPILTTSSSPQLDNGRRRQDSSPATFDLPPGGAESAGRESFCSDASQTSVCRFHQGYSSSFSVLSAKPDDLRRCFKCGSNIRRRLSKSGVLSTLICRRGHTHHVTLELAMGYKKLRCKDSSRCSLCTLWPNEGSETTELLSNFINSSSGKGCRSSDTTVALPDGEKTLNGAPPTAIDIVQPCTEPAPKIIALGTETVVDLVADVTPDQQTSSVDRAMPSPPRKSIPRRFSLPKAVKLKRPTLSETRNGGGHSILRKSLEELVASQPLIRGNICAKSTFAQLQTRRLNRLCPKPPNVPEDKNAPLSQEPKLQSAPPSLKTSSNQAPLEFQSGVIRMVPDNVRLLQIAPESQKTSLLRMTPVVQNTFLRLTPETLRFNPPITLSTAWPSILRYPDAVPQPPKAPIPTMAAPFRIEDDNASPSASPSQVVEVKMVSCEDGYELESCEPVASARPTHRYKSILKLRVDETAVAEEPKESSVVGSSTDVNNSAESHRCLKLKSETDLQSITTEVSDVSIFEPIVKMELNEVEDERDISDLSEDELEKINGMNSNGS